MSDLQGKPFTTLAIAEKKPHRSGGCASIFFQLFDWNRRLAKKKLFSKKFLPPVRTKRASRKFNVDEKMPVAKLLLIDEENRGGFPSKKSDNDRGRFSSNDSQNNETQAPGLVARLMGLESMPAVHNEKTRKAEITKFFDEQGRKSLTKQVDNQSSSSEHLCHDRQITEMSQLKVGLMPEKAQKIGFFDRKPVNKFGAEALQFRSALSHSKKTNQKLVQPVRSPRILGRNAVRLMEAASKILEPGLQSTHKSKCALTYSSSSDVSLAQQAESNQSDHAISMVQSIKVQPSYENCGNLTDTGKFISDFGDNNVEFRCSASNLSISSVGLEKNELEPHFSTLIQERYIKTEKSAIHLTKDKHRSFVNQTVDNEEIRVIKSDLLQQNDQAQRTSRVHKGIPAVPRHNGQKLIGILGQDKVPSKPRNFNHQMRRDTSLNAGKDFPHLNQNLSRYYGKNQGRVLRNGNDIEKRTWDKGNDSNPKAQTVDRKRRSTNSAPQLRNPQIKQRNISNGTNVKGRPSKPSAKGSWSNNSDPVSFMFNSPLGNQPSNSSSLKIAEMQVDENDVLHIARSKNVNQSDGNVNKLSPKVREISGDALGALLEQKLRELKSLEAEETMGNKRPEKSAASILQELIDALTVGQPVSQENENSCSFDLDPNDVLQCRTSEPIDHLHQDSHEQKNSKAKVQIIAENGVNHSSHDCNHYSPGSILEASFSNDSCFSESCDGDSPGRKLHVPHSDQSYGDPLLFDNDADVSDSATSMNTWGMDSGITSFSLSEVSPTYGIDLISLGLTGNKLDYSQEIISNVNILFENLPRYTISPFADFYLLEELEILWRTSGCSGDQKGDRDSPFVRNFLFDCIIEYFDSKYSHYSELGFGILFNQKPLISIDRLAKEIFEEISRWGNLAGKVLDEIVESDASFFPRKWEQYEIGSHGMSSDIQRDILEILVDEIVCDLG